VFQLLGLNNTLTRWVHPHLVITVRSSLHHGRALETPAARARRSGPMTRNLWTVFVTSRAAGRPAYRRHHSRPFFPGNNLSRAVLPAATRTSGRLPCLLQHWWGLAPRPLCDTSVLLLTIVSEGIRVGSTQRLRSCGLPSIVRLSALVPPPSAQSVQEILFESLRRWSSYGSIQHDLGTRRRKISRPRRDVRSFHLSRRKGPIRRWLRARGAPTGPGCVDATLLLRLRWRRERSCGHLACHDLV